MKTKSLLIVMLVGASSINVAFAMKNNWFGWQSGHQSASKFFFNNTASWKEGQGKLYRWISNTNRKYSQSDRRHIRVGAHNSGGTGYGMFLKSFGTWSDGSYAFNFNVWDYSIPTSRGVSEFDVRRTWHACWLLAQPGRGRHRVEIDLLEGAETRYDGHSGNVRRSPGGQFTSQFNVYVGTGNGGSAVNNVYSAKWVYWYNLKRWSWTNADIAWGRNPDMNVIGVTAGSEATRYTRRVLRTGWKPRLNWRNFKDNPPKTRRVKVIVQNRPWGYDASRNKWHRCSTLEIARIITPY